VFDSGYADIALLQDGSHAGIAHLIGLRGQVDDLGKINAVKDDAGVGRSRTQGEFHPPARMKADTLGADGFLYGALT
jgi:hypothetical protein